MLIRKAYAVRGDSGNVGNGSILGVFLDPEEAAKNAVGRGSLDCGGDGIVEEVHLVGEFGEVYLLAGLDTYKFGTMKPDPRKEPTDWRVSLSNGPHFPYRDLTKRVIAAIRSSDSSLQQRFTLVKLLGISPLEASAIVEGVKNDDWLESELVKFVEGCEKRAREKSPE